MQRNANSFSFPQASFEGDVLDLQPHFWKYFFRGSPSPTVSIGSKKQSLDERADLLIK